MPDFFSNITIEAHLGPDQFGAEFGVAWDLLSVQFFKFECQQYYDEGVDNAFLDFSNGRIDSFVRKLTAARREDAPSDRAATDRGVRCIRVHAVTTPLTEYVRFESYSYALSEVGGERISMIDLSVAERLAGALLRDFLLFDDRVLFVLNFENGVFQGVDKSTDPADIARTTELAERLRAGAVPFRQIANLDPLLEVQLLRAYNA